MKQIRFFGARMAAQERYLNAMAQRGFRLHATGTLVYEFVPCEKGEYQYAVDFVGHRTPADRAAYMEHLTECGYTLYEKNMQLMYSVGHVRYRPWADPGARLATMGTSLQRELLIVERKQEETPFRLHTTAEDQRKLLRPRRNMYALSTALLAVAAVVQPNWMGRVIFAVLAMFFLLPTVLHWRDMHRLRGDTSIFE